MRRGFTLTEILVALLVTVLAIIPLLNLNTISRRRGQQGESYALAQVEAERLVNQFAGTLGFDDLTAKLGVELEAEFGESDPDVAAVLSSSTGLEQAARDVKRQVRLRRLDTGLLLVTATIQWKSTAPEQNLKFSADRFVGNPRACVAVHHPFVTPIGVQGCQ